MAMSLKCLLDQVPGARDVLPHLAALQGGLAAEGAAVLDTIPLPSLQRMGAQLTSLPVRPDDVPLRALQVQLMAALARRAAATMPKAPTPVVPAFVPTGMGHDKLEVMEISASEWAAASDMMDNGPGHGPFELQPR